MGSHWSKMSEEEEQKRCELKKQLKKMQESLDKKAESQRCELKKQLERMQESLDETAESHYESSDYYNKWDLNLYHASWVTGILGSPWPGILLSTWASKTTNGTKPRFVAIFGAASAMCLAFTLMVNSSLPNSPHTLAQQHLDTGLECRKLQKQVQFFAKSDVCNPEVPWSTLEVKYENLLEKRKEINSKIKSEHWAYDAVKARKQKKEKQKKEELQG